ncbi:MAG: sigma-70 family RNA polymerase sigma factor [Prevotella sp.]|nr:sigma-70 family RNA polymerase sigma factor [Prevotella sp.]
MEKNSKIVTESVFPKMKCLTLEEQHDLIERVKQGSQEAEEELESVYVPFVYSIAKQYFHKGVSEGNLLKAGKEGLVKAAHNYNPTRRFKFIAYAVWYIRQDILAVLKDFGNEEGQKEVERWEKKKEFNHMLESGQFANDITTMIEELEPREKEIICLTYGIGCEKCADGEICDKLGLTEPRLLRIRSIAKNKLEKIFHTKTRKEE